jgi:hypothetical protein
MNTDTGEIKYVSMGKELKPPWIPIGKPNPKCPRCKGKGAILGGNRAERRHNLRPMEYIIPCPECSGKSLQTKPEY